MLEKQELRVFVVDVVEPKESDEMMKFRLEEIENLIKTYKWIVIMKIIQRKSRPDYNYYVWTWKLDEIMEEMKQNDIKVLIFWNNLKNKQIYKLNTKLEKIWAIVWDKVDLILKIFEQNAKTVESKLQIELASIKHMWPRIFWMWMELSRQWWWIWTSWIWETNIEIMKRHLSQRREKILEKLKKFENVRILHRQWRKDKNLQTVWIVWYTNAWKSTLLNSLTKKWVEQANKLFTTLDSSIWKFVIERDWKYIEILISDTIGFINDLPLDLIKAFKSTLEESCETKLLIHLVDCTDPCIKIKIDTVNNILQQIWASQKKIYVFNKIDKLQKNQVSKLKKDFKEYNPIFISAENKLWIDELKNFILENL